MAEVNTSTVDIVTTTSDGESTTTDSLDSSIPKIIENWSNPTYEWVEANIDVANCCVTLDDSVVDNIKKTGFKEYFDFDSREMASDAVFSSGADSGYSEAVGLPASKAINSIIYSSDQRNTSKYYIVPGEELKTSIIKTVKENFPNPSQNIDYYGQKLGKELCENVRDNGMLPLIFDEWCLNSYFKRLFKSEGFKWEMLWAGFSSVWNFVTGPVGAVMGAMDIIKSYYESFKDGYYLPHLCGNGKRKIDDVYVIIDGEKLELGDIYTSYDPLFNKYLVYQNPERAFYFGDAFIDELIPEEEFEQQISDALGPYGSANGQYGTANGAISDFVGAKRLVGKTVPALVDRLLAILPDREFITEGVLDTDEQTFDNTLQSRHILNKMIRGTSNAFNLNISLATWSKWKYNGLLEFADTVKRYLFRSTVTPYTPIVIDSRVGSYLTEETVRAIIKKAFEYVRNNLGKEFTKTPGANNGRKNLNSGRRFKDAALGNGSSIKGTEMDRCFNFKLYAHHYGDAYLALFETCFEFEKMNHAAILNFIADNLLVVHKEEVNEVVEEEIELTGDESLDTRSRRLAQRQKLSKEYNTSDKDLRIDMRNKATGDSNSNCVYYLSDYNWSMNEKALNKMGLKPADFPYIRVYELQPDRRVSFKKIADNIAGVVDQASNWLLGTAGTIVTALVNKLGATTTEAQAYSSNTKWVDDLLAGDWVGQYDIPYFGNDFFKSSGSSGWSMGNLLEKSDFLKNSLTMNVQDIPTWQYTPGEGQTLTCPIVLVNETIEDFIKNLKFLYSFTMGSFWLQESFLRYRSPNLYRLICPGRFVYLYAALDVSAEYLGKIKRYSTADAKRFFGEDDSAFENFKPLKRYITGMDTCNIPEAFKVSATFKNLTPNAFNIINGYMTVSESAQNIIPNITTRASGSSYFVDTAIDTVKNLVSGDHTSLTSQEAIASRLTGKSAEEIEELKKDDPEIAKMINDQKVKEEAERKKQEAQQEQKG